MFKHEIILETAMPESAARLEWQRQYRRANGNANTKKYEKTKRGFLMRAYRNIESRVAGLQQERSRKLYAGLPVLDRQDFYEWGLNSPEFNRLWAAWVAAGHPRRLAPSPDRINSAGGYTLENMQWVTLSENSRRGALSRWGKLA